jgi:glycosyltransferase involved in cell wall biosynthesis
MSPNISVCIATYNGEKFIKQQIASILSQLDSNDEVIISDDSSTDNTINIVKSFNDNRIKIFENNTFRNHIKNFEFAISKSQGKYIFLSDQDDIWLENKVKDCLIELKNYNLIVTNCVYINGNDEIINDSYFKFINAGSGLIKNFIKNTFLGCCMAFDRKILEKALPFPAKIVSHDNWIGLISEMYGTTKFLDKKLMLFRRHGKNFSANNGTDSMISGKSPFSLKTILKNRVYLLIQLFLIFLKNIKYV